MSFVSFLVSLVIGVVATAAPNEKSPSRPQTLPVQALVQVQAASSNQLSREATPKFAGVNGTPQPAADILSFTEWKNLKISERKERIQKLRIQYNEVLKLNPRSTHLAEMRQDLMQEQWNLEVAQDLSARDYLLLYVKSNESRRRLPEIAARLSADEVSEFLESYFRMLETSNPNPAKRTRLGIQAQ